MKFKLIVDKIDDVAEPYRDLYEEKDGKYHFSAQFEGIDNLSGLVSALNSARAEKKELEKKYQPFKDMDADKIKSQAEELEALKAKDAARGVDDAEAEKKIQERIKTEVDFKVNPLLREKETLEQKARESMAQVEMLTKEKRQSIIDAALRTEIVKAGVMPTGVEHAVILWREHFDLLPDGVTVMTKDHKQTAAGIRPEVWIDTQKKIAPHFWPAAVGGGASGSSGTVAGGNPFAKGAFNMKKASEIVRRDPGEANRLAKEAGFETFGQAIEHAASLAK